LHKHVQDEADRLQKETHRLDLSEKARNFRFPYWDWGIKTGNLEDRFPLAIFEEKNIKLAIDPNSSPIRNPLASFHLNEALRRERPGLRIPGFREMVRIHFAWFTFRCCKVKLTAVWFADYIPRP
jgi:hypothetical protein